MEHKTVDREDAPEGVQRITDRMAEIFVGESLTDILMSLCNMIVFACVRFSESREDAAEKMKAVHESLDVVYDAYLEEDAEGRPQKSKGTLQ